MRTTRRRFLSCLAATTGSAALARSAPLGCAEPLQPLSIALLRSLMDQPRSAAALGARYRRQFPAEDRPRLLAARIAAAIGLAGTERLSRGQLRAMLDARVRAEFAAGDSVQLGGWVLARTEARLWALCA